jgi:hypothetical protein
MFFVGPIPAAYKKHMVHLGALDLTKPIWAFNDSTSRVAEWRPDLWEHNVEDCGSWALLSAPHLRVVGACTRPGGALAFSPHALGIGVEMNTSHAVLFRSKDVAVHNVLGPFAMVWVLLFAMAWLHWTRDIYTTIHMDQTARWTTISVTHVTYVNLTMLLILSHILTAHAMDNTALYTLDSVELVGIEYFDWIFYAYTFVFVPTLVLTVLLCVAFINVKLNTQPVDSALRHSTALFFVALTVMVSSTIFLYETSVITLEMAVVADLYGFGYLTYMRIRTVLRKELYRHQLQNDVLLVYVAWAVRLLILTYIVSDIPYEVGGYFIPQLQNIVGVTMAFVIPVVNGRTIRLLLELNASDVIILVMPLLLFSLVFSTAVGMSALYMPGLHGRHKTALLCSASQTLVMVYVGIIADGA